MSCKKFSDSDNHECPDINSFRLRIIKKYTNTLKICNEKYCMLSQIIFMTDCNVVENIKLAILLNLFLFRY